MGWGGIGYRMRRGMIAWYGSRLRPSGREIQTRTRGIRSLVLFVVVVTVFGVRSRVFAVDGGGGNAVGGGRGGDHIVGATVGLIVGNAAAVIS